MEVTPSLKMNQRLTRTMTKSQSCVSRMTEAGKDVKMNKADPHVRNGRTGEKTALREEEGVYVMDANVKAEKEISQRNWKSAPERRKN